MADRLVLRLTADAEAPRIVRSAVRRLALDHGAGHDGAESAALAVSEAVTNVVRHAYAGRAVAGDVCVIAWASNGKLQLEVGDTGRGNDEPSPDPGAGLGTSIIEATVEALSVRTTPAGGTHVHMRLPLT